MGSKSCFIPHTCNKTLQSRRCQHLSYSYQGPKIKEPYVYLETSPNSSFKEKKIYIKGPPKENFATSHSFPFSISFSIPFKPPKFSRWKHWRHDPAAGDTSPHPLPWQLPTMATPQGYPRGSHQPQGATSSPLTCHRLAQS